MPEQLEPVVSWVTANLPWIILTVVMHMVVLGTVAYMILGERKVAAWAQDRVGPNRAGLGFGVIPFLKNYRFLGLGQSFADGLKMFTKEDYRAPQADKWLFTLAPMIMMTVVVISIAVIPWGGTYGRSKTVDVSPGASVAQVVGNSVSGAGSVQGAVEVTALAGNGQPVTATLDDAGDLVDDRSGEPRHTIELSNIKATFTEGWRFQIASLNIGVVFILAVLSLAVYGVTLGGYASNNKYSFLGGLRATANMISYEIPLGLTVLTICLMFGSFDLHDIVNSQAKYWLGIIPAWNVFAHPLTFILFLICIHAEANRTPFDTAECEQELVGGYHTEYSSMRFGMFFLAEYAGMITTSAIAVALFFGGWHVPWIDYLWTPLSGTANTHVTDSLIAGVIRIACFFGKTLGIVFIFMWVRWSIPRFRFDQIMGLAWKVLIPITLGMLVATAVGVYIVARAGGTTSNGLGGREALLFLGINGAVTALTFVVGGVMGIGKTSSNNRILVPGSRYTAAGAIPGSAPATVGAGGIAEGAIPV